MDRKFAVPMSSARSRRRRLLTRLCVGAIVVVALVVSLVSLALALSSSFPDVPSSHQYYAAITDLASRGIIGGYSNGNFGPSDPLMRQQFAKMAVLTGGYPVSEADVCPFTDVPTQTGTDPFYPSKYVAVCAANNITNGKTATRFDPYGFVTRYQVTTMVVRMADDLQPNLLAAPPAGWTGNATWAADPTHGSYAARAEYNGLLFGLSLASLSPYENMTRGEVAQVLYNLLGKLTPPTTTTTSASTTTTTAAVTTTTSSSTTTTSIPTTTTTLAVTADYAIAGLETAQLVLTVRDQFGNPMPNVGVRITSSALEGVGLALFSNTPIGSTDPNGVIAYTWGQDGGDWGVEQVTAWANNGTLAGFTSNPVLVQWIYDDRGTNFIHAVNNGHEVTVPSGYAPWGGMTLTAYRNPGGAQLGSGIYSAVYGLFIGVDAHWLTGDSIYVGASSTNDDEKRNWMYNTVQ